jgi:hypothetical protein
MGSRWRYTGREETDEQEAGVVKATIDLTRNPAGVPDYEERDANVALVRVRLPDGTSVASPEYLVEVRLTRDAMLGLATELLRILHGPHDDVSRHTRPIDSGGACKSLGFYLAPQSCELLFNETELRTTEEYLAAEREKARLATDPETNEL